MSKLFPFHSQQTFLILGMGKSGKATKDFLQNQSASVQTFDDNLELADYHLQNLKDISWEKITAVIQSPGIHYQFPSPHPITALAKEKNIPIITDLNLLQQANPFAQYIGVTGTNGKSTTTALIAHLLECHQQSFAMGGNIGIPALALPPLEKGETYVLELSSYQLEIAPPLDLDIAVWLNITEDHLDRHNTLENYVATKERVFSKAKQAVISVDDSYSVNVYQRHIKTSKALSVSCKDKTDVWVKDSILYHHNEEIINLNACENLKGSHNHQNAAMAFAVGSLLKIPKKVIIEAFINFPGLAHRQEIVGHYKNIIFVNDSKATNADATSYALESYQYHPIYWILGGVPKSQGIKPLERYFSIIKHAFLIGKSQQEFAQTLEGKAPYNFSEEIQIALQQAIDQIQQDQPYYHNEYHPVILLSPACASFDQFQNFEHRGDVFRQLVRQFIQSS